MKKVILIKKRIKESADVKSEILNNPVLIDQILEISQRIIRAYKANKKVIFCGNGGSAADAQHLSAELSGRYLIDRDPLDSDALHVNTSYLTAVANDYGYGKVFSRLVKAKCESGDVLISLSTSGNSINVINAIKAANKINVTTVGFTGKNGGEMVNCSNITVLVPSNEIPRIQESHLMLGHIICEIVESELF